MRKCIAFILALVMVMMCAVASADYTAGTYTATATGMVGEFPVTVTFDENAIVSFEIGENNETKGLGTIPLEQLPGKIIESQSVAIDAIGGATVTSNALLAAVLDCVAQAGGDVDVWTAKQAEQSAAQAEDIHTDVVIVGGGAAGLTAGINARYSGAENVILLEKMAFCGGSTALSGGAMTRVAMEGDPEGTMTAQEMYDYFLTMASEQVERDQLQLYVDNSDDVWCWFTSLEGGETTHMFHNTPENVYTTYPDGQGQGVVNVLENEAVKNGVDIRKNHNVTALLTDENGTVVGVKCTNADGAEQNLYAKSVILATGGFANDKDMLMRFGGTNAGTYVVRKGAGGANGDGIQMAESVGAKLVFGDKWDTSGQNTDWIPYRPEGFTMSLFYSSQLYGIMVNDEGNRFVNESLMLPRIYEEMVNQINADHVTFHAIETLEGFEACGATAQDLEAAVAQGAISKYDTIEDVAAAIGVPAENLRVNIESYASPETDEFGKTAAYLGKLNPEGPFYVGETKPQRSGTMGGIAINTKSEVLDTNGNPIPNLYAAGETANGTFFGNYYYICGNMVMHAMITGREAGINAAANAK